MRTACISSGGGSTVLGSVVSQWMWMPQARGRDTRSRVSFQIHIDIAHDARARAY